MNGSGNGDGLLGDVMAARRAHMVRDQLVARDIRDRRVLGAMSRVERHRFVPGDQLDCAYRDHPVTIGFEQTLSQPYIVALMTQSLALTGAERVLEIGTGSGYQTAILAELARAVYTIEIVSELSARAQKLITSLGYHNVRFRLGNGREGWSEEAPFDAILVAAAPEAVPVALIEQVGPGGRLVIPVGPAHEQELELHVRENHDWRVTKLGAVRFVPLI
ncbi:MAG TPA: protein-L-isoaspartate(D-aspartate) O-methyltransferase [Vicinamibacteria bacterium]|nr:protein-L-isoaspartate(D-aspartate) O-methyltransferase [Vicinamibacteria bacterium]